MYITVHKNTLKINERAWGIISGIQNRDKVKPPIPSLNQTVGLHLCPESWFETDPATTGLPQG